jgi:hypothetical protein
MTSVPHNLYEFRQQFSDVEGFYWPQSEAVWSFLLTSQNSCDIAGNFLEIGVFRGRSAHLVSQFLSPDEICILVDVNDISAVGDRMAQYGRSPTIVQCPSDQLNRSKATQYRGSCRLIHVDGDHSGHAVLTDLDTAKEYIGPRGMIVVDDYYNAQYPQITAATYRWLDVNPEYRTVLCGFNKGYLVHARDYDLYESLIRHHLSPYLEAVGEDASLTKTSYAHDMGCWGIVHKGNRLIVGRDQNQDDVPY